MNQKSVVRPEVIDTQTTLNGLIGGVHVRICTHVCTSSKKKRASILEGEGRT